MQDIVYTEKCTGCRSCEIACSYHFKKIFSRRLAGIEVKRFEAEGKFGIILYRKSEDGHIACDNCEFCLRYCPIVARDELKSIIRESLSKE